MFVKEPLNLEKSITFHNSFGNVQIRSCYDNVYSNLMELKKLALMGNSVEVVFCYMHVMDNIYTRHVAFTLEGELIDITYAALALKHGNESPPSYIELERYSLSQYVSALTQERTTGLHNLLASKCLAMTLKLAQEEQILLID